MTTIIGELETRVCGIPCIVAILSWERFVPAKTYGPPESCYPEEGGCGEWEIRDRRGRPAAWLERKMSEGDRQHIDELVFEYMESQRDEFY